MSPAGSRPRPALVPSTTLSAGLAATEVAVPWLGAAAISSQLTPPFGEEKIRSLPPLAQARIRSLAFTAPSSAPAGCPSAWGAPTVHAEMIGFTSFHAPL